MSQSGIISKSSLDERRDNADIICLQMLYYLLDQKQYESFIKTFQMHFHLFKTSFESMNASATTANSFSLKISHQRIEEIRWRANWHLIVAKMLEATPLLFTQDNIYLKAAPLKKGQAP